MTPTAWGFLMMGAFGLVLFLVVWVFDRPKTPKEPPSEGKGPFGDNNDAEMFTQTFAHHNAVSYL